MRYLSLIVALFFIILPVVGDDTVFVYGKVDEQKYLTGMFSPQNNSEFVELSSVGIAGNGRNHYLRRKTAAALKKMITAFHGEHPKINVFVISSTRTYYHQKAIWNAKFSGNRKVGGKRLNKSEPDPYRRSVQILKYSSMPGTSRHHWGTDFDLNSLVNSYFDSGDGKILYAWLIKNSARFGFYQVYTAGRTAGYNEERWHWSYLPESSFLLKRWVAQFKNDSSFFAKKGSFQGSEYAGRLAYLYVTAINPDCKR